MRYLKWLAVGIIVGLLLVGIRDAAAQSIPGRGVCLPHDKAVTKLQQQYGEHSLGLGVVKGAMEILEVFVNPETRTWTALVTRANGMSCVGSAGEGWMGAVPEVSEGT